MKARVLFMGTPAFAVPSLRFLASDQRFELVGVVTQPDKPAGRGLRITSPPVKIAADALGLPALQPASLRTEEAQAAIRALAPDVCAVAAYGQWIPAEVFDLPPKRSINMHPSLVPRHRGAAPVISTLLSGDRQAGLSVIFVEDEMDVGDLLAQMIVGVGEEETTDTIMAKLARFGAPFFADILAAWVGGEITPVEQDHRQATWISRLEKDAGRIDWTLSAEELARQCRALKPWPGTFTYFKGRRLLIHRCTPLKTPDDFALNGVDPGRVVHLSSAVAVGTGQGLLALHEVQLAGRKRMDVGSFLHGRRDFAGSSLG